MLRLAVGFGAPGAHAEELLDNHTIEQAMKEMQGLADALGGYAGGAMALNGSNFNEDDGEVDFEEFCNGWERIFIVGGQDADGSDRECQQGGAVDDNGEAAAAAVPAMAAAPARISF